MPDEFCPSCREPRIGSFRYCRSCAFDFDAIDPATDETPTVAGWVPPPKGRPVVRYAAVGLVAFIGLGALGNLLGGGTGDAAPSQASVESPRQSATTVQASPAPSTLVLALAPTGPTQEATVVSVTDGDTIVVDIGGTEYRIRYIGMDTPESVAPDSPIEPLALASTAANEALVAGKTVLLEKDVSETDQFDRLLRNVWVERDGVLVLVGLELVRMGLADVSTYPPDVKYADLLLDAVGEARTQALGLWAPAASVTPAPTPEPTPAPAAEVFEEVMFVEAGDRAGLRGGVGSYTWSAVEFAAAQAIVRWSVSGDAACRVVWQVEAPGNDTLKRTIRVAAGATEKGVERYDTPFSDGVVKVGSTCPTWLITMEGNDPPVAGGGSDCHPSYSPCLPIVGDLDCPDVRAMGKAPVTVKGPDEYRLDRDNDGLGCE